MATEDDKTNTGIAGTAIAVGVAAMIAGSSALVGMARTQVDEVSQATQAYADLSSVNELKSEQAARLSGAKVSIDKARQLTLKALQGDAQQASPWSSKADVAASANETQPAASAGQETAPAGSAEGAASAAPSSVEGAGSAAPNPPEAATGATNAPAASSH